MLDLLPEDIKNNVHLKSYTKYGKQYGKIAYPDFKAERVPDERDEPAIVNASGTVKEPVYYGNWVDCTEQAQREWDELHKKVMKESEEEMDELKAALKRLYMLKKETK